MRHLQNKVEDLRIAYIGGGSRGWAWNFMSDLVSSDDISGTVSLYDIDFDAAYKNQIIGNKYNKAKGAKSIWNYEVADSLEEALTNADFVIISILPGTFKEMSSDVHCPEKYGIYQSVGDTIGPGGILRALRTIPMFEEIALAIKKFCPKAWVINYTNPMSMCVKTLYKVFPSIKAFGCCHEVFNTQNLLKAALKEMRGIDGVEREDIKVNVLGINHFTWFTKAYYKNIDLFDVYREFIDKYYENGYFIKFDDKNWMNSCWVTGQKVKMDLFKRYGYIAAAGDRHLAEFCPGKWYLESHEAVRKKWLFDLTPVSWRIDDLKDRLERREGYLNGNLPVEIKPTGEDGVNQIRALLGLHDMISNVNLPNVGQIPNLPLGAIVETNATFRADEVLPVNAGNIPMPIYPLISKILGEQENVVEGCLNRDLDQVFSAFAMDNNVNLPLDTARKLFDEMVENTKEYLTIYKKKSI